MNVVDHFVGFEGAGAQLFHVVALNDSIADLAVGEIPGDSHRCFSWLLELDGLSGLNRARRTQDQRRGLNDYLRLHQPLQPFQKRTL